MFNNLVHNPSLGSALALLNIAGLGSSLPVNAYAVLNLVNGRSYGQGGLPEISGVLSGLSGLTAAAYSADHVYTPTDGSWASQQLITNANSIAGEQGAAQAAYTDMQTHAAALQALRDHLTASSRLRTFRTPRRRSSLSESGRPTRPPSSRRSTQPMPRNATRRSNARMSNWRKTWMPSPATRPHKN